jgi:fatty-acyl-CoA synthase
MSAPGTLADMIPGRSRAPGDLNWILDSLDAQIPTGDPDACAISLDGTERWTYAQLRAARDRLACALLDLGVARGDRVAVLLSNCLEYMALHFALMRIGAVAVRLNFRLTAPELRYALEDSGASVLCLHSSYEERIDQIRDQVGVGRYLAFPEDSKAPSWALDASELPQADARRLPAMPPDPDDPMMLMYTSGTTGFPKAAVWLASTCVASASMQALYWGYDESTVALTTGPLYHAGSLEHMLIPALFRRGRAVFMASGGFSVERMVETIEREGVTDLGMSPFMLYDLVRMDCDLSGPLSTLRNVECGGDSIMPWAIAAFHDRLPHVGLFQGYGLTEAVSMMLLEPRHLEAHPDSVGRPLPLHSAKVIRDDGTLAGPGEVGEILLAGPAVCAGYWGRPEATTATFADGWLHTGDLGHVSADGFLTVTGRKKDMYRSGGENVYPAEVEGVLTQHPKVLDAAVVGVPHERYLEVGCAVLVVEGEPPTDTELKAWCRGRLAGYKCPRHLVWVDELPRNASGKVLKHVLRESYQHLGSLPTGPAPAKNAGLA